MLHANWPDFPTPIADRAKLKAGSYKKNLVAWALFAFTWFFELQLADSTVNHRGRLSERVGAFFPPVYYTAREHV